MTTLLIGFVGIVFIPALILSFILTKLNKPKSDYGFKDDSLTFTISSDSK